MGLYIWLGWGILLEGFLHLLFRGLVCKSPFFLGRGKGGKGVKYRISQSNPFSFTCMFFYLWSTETRSTVVNLIMFLFLNLFLSLVMHFILPSSLGHRLSC